MSEGSEDASFTQEEFDAKLEEAVSGLKGSQATALTEAKAAKKALREMKDAWGDLDPEEVRSVLAASKEKERDRQKEEGDFDAREKQLTAAHAKERQKDEQRMGKLTSELRKAIVTSKLTQAISDQKGDAKLLLPHAERFVDVRETENGFEAYVTDGDGHARVADGQGTPMTFGQLVETELMSSFPGAFEGTGSSGSGASKSTGGAGGAAVVESGDGEGFIKNLEGIAAGTVEVR